MGIIDNIINGVTAKNDRARDRAFRNAAGDAGRIATEAATGNRAAGRTAEAVIEGRANQGTILNSGRNIYNEEQRRASAEERDRARQEREAARKGTTAGAATPVTPAAPAPRETAPAAAAIATPVATPVATAEVVGTPLGPAAPVAAAAAAVTTTDTAPTVTAADPTATNYFWNAYSNIQAQVGPPGGYDFNRELLTYIQADDRYLSHMESYADMKGLTGAERTTLLDEARRTHRESNHTLDTSPGYSTDMQGAANDFFFVIEQAAAEAPAAPAPASVVDTPAPASVAEAPATAVFTSYTPAVTTAMGDVAIPEVAITEPVTPEAPPASVTPAAPEAPAAPDTSFTETQLGSLAQTPEGGITNTPVTAPIAIEDMPVPIPHEQRHEPVVAEDTSNFTMHEVERGQNLWKIARNHYGLDNPADIQRAVDSIAIANNMTEGVQANRLSIGQVIKLPDSPVPPSGEAGLDWAALDADRLRNTFNRPAAGNALAQDTPQVDVDRTATGPTLPTQQGTGGLRFA